MFGLQRWQVENTVKLIDEGNTIPFIARYRKEAHGTLDDQVLRELSEKLEYLRNLDKRREEISASITAQEKMTPEIEAALEKASTLAEIEDIYRPFRPKRRTRASIAKEKGLEPLADAIFAQVADSASPTELAADYIDAEKGVETVEDAINGARDIIAENISDDADIRRRLRSLFTVAGVLQSRAADSEKESVYTMYYEYDEPVNKIAGHRVLAVNRGENEGFLKVGIDVDRIKALNIINANVLSDNSSACTDIVRDAAADAYDRLIFPSVEREIRNMITDSAVESALKVFYVNLRELLLQPPVKGKRALGLDPGYRTGCKVAVVDETGKVLDTGVIYVTHSEEQKLKAKQTVKRLIEKYGVEVIAIGNGTASKETEIFAADLIKELGETLDGAVEYCVNSVGADVNTASPSLLSHIAGINSGVAKNIVTYREENGAFTSRAQLKKVPKLGAKAYEQCAGFIRVPESKNVLDNTGVHPESYDAAKALLELCGLTVKDAAKGNTGALKATVELLGGEKKVAEKLEIGLPTLQDIIKELQKPGRDPRDELPPPLLRTDVMDINDLKPGMELKGTVRNVIDFGAFVDIGVHQDGLVHISQITNKYIKHPSEVLKVGDIVTVWVLAVDVKKNRISLTMKKDNVQKPKE